MAFPVSRRYRIVRELSKQIEEHNAKMNRGKK